MIEWLWHLDRYEDRTVEIHAGGGVPFREVRRVLWTVDTAAWRAWFRVIGEDGVAALPYSFDEVRDLKRSEWEPDPPALVVHLRSSGMWVVHKKSVGLEVPKIDHKQDFLALKELMTRDRELFPGDTIAVLNTDDDVPYSEMIAAFQLARAHGYRIALAGGPPSLTSDTPVSTPPGFDASNATALGDSPSVTGALPRADIEAVVKRNMNQLRYCYQRELVKSPKLAGEIKVKFVITKDGSVSSATTKSSTMNSPAVESCLNGRFLRFTFPPPQGGGIVIVQYPFTFSRE